MKVFSGHSVSSSRIWFNATFALLLLCAVGSRAATATEWNQVKALQLSVDEFSVAVDNLYDDPPEFESLVTALVDFTVAAAPMVLGYAQTQQFSPMVFQLRDRLMHAPPAFFQNVRSA